MIYDVLIAGAGVIGGMLARELSKYKLTVCLLEKENDVACGASKANSGIVHGGYDPVPGTLKAKLNAPGVSMLFDAAQELNVPYECNGSLVVAFGEEDDLTVKALYDRGIQNGIEELKIISGDEARQLEPALSDEVTTALSVPQAGIICPYELTVAAVGNAMDNGAVLKRNFEITSIVRENDIFMLTSADGNQVSGKYLVNCAGGYADRIAALAGDGFFKIIPRAGEYMLLDKAEGKCVSHTVFQAPSDNGKGVLVTPTTHGNLLVGPTAGVVNSPDNTETTSDGLSEVSRLSHKSIPSVNLRNVITSFSGVRASEKNRDFIIKASENVNGLVHTAAIDSPGLSSCVAIGRYVVKLLHVCGLALEEKENWNGHREDSHFFAKMSDEQKDEYIKAHPDYGRIVCRCETVSEGEIRAAIKRNPKATDIDGVKRRTRSGMGRCQGGFCSPFVMKLLAEENDVPMERITKKGESSEMLTGRL